MALKNRKIRTQHRGTRNCGRGKKGSRPRDGGKGMAGTHKHKFSWVTTKCPDYFGSEPMHPDKQYSAVNVGYLNDQAVKADSSEVDVMALGYQKVLGGGEVTKAITVKAKAFTVKAKEKIEAAGGKALTV